LFVLSFIKGCINLSLEDFFNMICELKISVCIPPFRNMRRPPIYPQLPHLHDHGLAILAYITPFWNMLTPSISTLNQSTPFHLKRSCWRSDFSTLISSKPPSPKEIEHKKKEKKRKKKYWKKERKLQESLQIKGEVNILRGEKRFNFKKSFYMIPFSLPPSYHFENVFQIIEKIFLTLFGPSFSLAIYMNWVVHFSFTQELHIFSL
jgi:hypothetical protein